MLWLPLVSLVVLSQGEGLQASPASSLDVDPSVRQSPDDPVVLEEVEVRGRRGAALLDPQVELDGVRIDALGAYDIGEVLRRLTENYGLGDAPLVIVNGRQMADPGVFSRFPPDALVRVEVLPPEAGGLYGATDPSRRVVNIVLQRQFASRDGRASLRGPTAGGMAELLAGVRRSSIIETRTRQLGLQLDLDTGLKAGDRRQSRPGEPVDEAVSLRPASERVSVNLAETGALGDWAASLNLQAQAQQARSVVSFEGEARHSRRRSDSLTATGGLNGSLAGWSAQASVNGQVSRSEQSGLSPSEASLQAISANLGLNRPLFDLPAGPLVANLSGRVTRSRSINEGRAGRLSFSGRGSDLGAVVSIPIMRAQSGPTFRFMPGALSMTAGATLTETDAGRGDGLNAGLAWTPWPKLRLNATWSTSTPALSDQQRFAPEYYGEPTLVYDFQTGEAVEVLPILGGNPDLRPPGFDRLGLSVSAGPFTDWALQGGLSLQRTEAVDEIGGLPDLTPEVEAAFPTRFLRNEEGRLVSIDRRPINLGSTVTETLSSNLNFNPLGSRWRGAGAASLQVGLNHVWQLKNVSDLHAGLPRLDRLAGDGGGMPRHQLGLQIDGRYRDWGLNLSGRWLSASRIRRDIGRDGLDDLKRGSFSAVDLRLSYLFRPEGENAQGRSRQYEGLRMELAITNLLDARPRATLGDGRPAPGYGRDDQDPLGRMAHLTLSRRF